jgi:hypothetical protein
MRLFFAIICLDFFICITRKSFSESSSRLSLGLFPFHVFSGLLARGSVVG